MANIAAPRFLLKHTVSQLKTLGFLIGTPTSGRKAELQTIISRRLSEPPPAVEYSSLLSIDMGIRNLGVCVVEAPHLTQSHLLQDRETFPLTVSAWQKVDVLEQLKTKHAVEISDSDYTSKERKEIQALRYRRGADLIGGDFTPANLAQAAYVLVSSLLTQHRPSTVLIERQRYRSGGAATVTEWTLRVNALEQMFWACLRTLSGQHPRQQSSDSSTIAEAVRALEAVHEVSPAKVAKFWCRGQQQDLQGTRISSDGAECNYYHTGDGGMVKKAEKIAVARKWVDAWKSGNSKGEVSVFLDFQGQAAETAEAFHEAVGKRKPRKKQGEEDVESIGKLDDLADCLLQGVAWVKWEENRRRLAKMVKEAWR